MAADNISIQDKIKDEFIKCATDPVYFMKKYFTIQHPTRGRMLFDLYPFQEKVLKIFQLPEDDIINKSRQLGISTLSAGLALHTMLFNKDKTILCIATKQETAHPEQVRRNANRFPPDFVFQLIESEVDVLLSHNAIHSKQSPGG